MSEKDSNSGSKMMWLVGAGLFGTAGYLLGGREIVSEIKETAQDLTRCANEPLTCAQGAEVNLVGMPELDASIPQDPALWHDAVVDGVSRGEGTLNQISNEVGYYYHSVINTLSNLLDKPADTVETYLLGTIGVLAVVGLIGFIRSTQRHDRELEKFF